jgi:streptogramin lyase
MPIATGQAYPTKVVAYGGQLYWTDLYGSVMTCATPTCDAPSSIAAGEAAGPFGLGVDESGVYWTNSAPGGGTVVRCVPAGPKRIPKVIARGQTGPYEFALDSVSVYWTDNGSGSVMRLAK